MILLLSVYFKLSLLTQQSETVELKSDRRMKATTAIAQPASREATVAGRAQAGWLAVT